MNRIKPRNIPCINILKFEGSLQVGTVLICVEIDEGKGAVRAARIKWKGVAERPEVRQKSD